ncbi:Na+/H+ antiporter subunit E [Halomonas sp. MCCC 1A17488]|uniref:Na+/H+ antiporter subunit E n=1 Tax=Billgrantia sulfidoxydans TaxID=2733484 RepID=A0ABX7W4J1_9GAMM|nr:MULTISPECIES: Na+/H+ antiporter subunit E [Halomonas]MCE8015470.1 Na+/H+ antiporter subunit E [Halomonas sp. MCCC 1A17488]MCG3238803.1 Na+/H+ antiporter subunit E [Halomonas sp. MCCC 1A17488]QPP51234.1 Na+/H+ antiporter subunit E [Halomonas sp. SS10-MC5]QTP54791.1 Na+/H+ antiporter subunit E [Halomonas sulfidoxydans]
MTPSSFRSWQFWLPHPLFSLFLALLWLLMVNDFSVAHALLGVALGVAIPFVTHAFWPEEAKIKRPLPLLRYLLVLLVDILRSNLVVALRILRPTRYLQPGFFVYPLALDDDFAITILASTISLTPGTVSIHHDAKARTLLVHALHLEDEAEAIATIRERYERPLEEIFR